MGFKVGDRVTYSETRKAQRVDSHGTITRRAGFDGAAWYVRWDNGNVGFVEASELTAEERS